MAGQFGFGLTGTEYLQMTLRLPLKEAETSASAPVSAELFGFVCSLLLLLLLLALGFATIGLAFIMHPQFFSLEFVSNMCDLGLAIVGLAFLSALNGS